jgi:DNA repair ATPase RecN
LIRYKKWLVLGKFAGFMLSAQQIQQLISANESLQLQLAEANEILAIQQEELDLLRQQSSETASLRSQLDLQQQIIPPIKEQQQYTDLQQQYIYVTTQLDDMQQELTALKKKNNMLQKIAVQVGELESKVENLTYERDILLEKIGLLEVMQEK